MAEIKITRRFAESWIAPKEGEATKTRYHHITYIRQFAIYLDSLGYDAYIVPRQKGWGSGSFVPYIFMHSQIRSIIKVADETEPRETAKNMHLSLPVLFRILYGCGLRVSEAVSLQCRDVDIESGLLTIREEKTGKDRLVLLSGSVGMRVPTMPAKLGGRRTRITFSLPLTGQ